MRSFPGGPRTRVAFLLAVALGVFFVPYWWACAAVMVTMAMAWLALGLGAGALALQVRKLVPISTLIIAGYALFAIDPATDRWVTLWKIDINTTGLLEGATMAIRILAVVMASHVARTGDPRALATGLRGLGMPRMVAAAIDATLALLGTERGGGGGRGTGGGKGKGKGKGGEGFRAAFKRMAKGDVHVIVDSLERHIDRVQAFLADRDPDLPATTARDIAVIAGVSLTMLGFKVLKILPGVPFAPGYKGVVLIPLYLVAASLTKTRLGATWTGLTMGTVAFLLGDGRYGVFEIAKHVAPGVLTDLLFGVVRRVAHGGRTRRVIAWSCLGMIAALGRFATITMVAFAVQPPAIVYITLLPGLLVHATFGVISGFITTPLMTAIEKREQRE